MGRPDNPASGIEPRGGGACRCERNRTIGSVLPPRARTSCKIVLNIRISAQFRRVERDFHGANYNTYDFTVRGNIALLAPVMGPFEIWNR